MIADTLATAQDALTGQASARLGALAHETRLTVFRALMRAGPEGLAAGALAGSAQVSSSNLSSHLNVLLGAGLVTVRRDGRQRIYVSMRPISRPCASFWAFWSMSDARARRKCAAAW